MARQFIDAGPLDSNLFSYYLISLQEDVPETGAVDLLLTTQPSAITKVVLVVDESVNHDVYVSEILPKWQSELTADFGEAASTGNCSAPSNALLRWGFRADELLQRHDPRSWPTIWAYARSAGYQTVYIDGQRRGAYQNYMRRNEARLIDTTISLSADIDTDAQIADAARKLLVAPGRTFIYINKLGAHFPFRDHVPKGSLPSKATHTEEYEAAVRYSSREFLPRMLSGVDLSTILVVYTSDHGQHLRFDPNRESGFHCNRFPHWQELSVPLAAATAAPTLAPELSEAAHRNSNRMRHTQIFPTLLIAMGYQREPAEAEYGASLIAAQPPGHYYYSAMKPIPTKSNTPLVTEFETFPFREAEARKDQGPLARLK
jgi:hypothetical protein